jgi:hypothetical protein
MSDWLVPGTAHRTPVQRTPIIHLIVRETGEMWCSGSKGRPDYPHGDRLCPKCKRLAQDAAAEEMLNPDEEPWTVARFLGSEAGKASG